MYERVKNVRLETTEKTTAFLKKEYPDEEWANREPLVMRGTTVTGDNFRKGRYDHRNAEATFCAALSESQRENNSRERSLLLFGRCCFSAGQLSRTEKKPHCSF